MSVFISNISNPYTNLSIGTYLTKKAGTELPQKILFLSSSHHGVFIGRNQNCWKECNMQKMNNDKVPLVRRDTGGGACYVDRGNRLFSFIEVTNNPQLKKYYPIVISSLNNLGLTARMQGSNDISIGDRKISGSAFTYDGKIFKHHGTILLNVDKEKLSTYLTPSKTKLQSKGINSVAARICNLTDINPRLTHEDLDREIIKSYQQGRPQPIVELNEDNMHKFIKDANLYEEIFKRYTSSNFLYNNNPDFTYNLEHRFSFGIVELLLYCSNNTIEKCEIFSDSLDLKLIECLRKALIFKNYKLESIETIRHELSLELGEEYREKIEEFCAYMHSKL